MMKCAALILAGGLVLLTAACMPQDQPLTPYQQQYYKHQQDYQTRRDNRRQNNRPCRLNNCM